MKTTSNERRDRANENAPANAQDTYRAARERVEKAVSELNLRLLSHGARQCRDQANWGYAGDLNHIAEILEQEAIAFLGVEARP